VNEGGDQDEENAERSQGIVGPPYSIASQNWQEASILFFLIEFVNGLTRVLQIVLK
jgi:hypothetical protein